jgi:hypothetical protein
MGLQIESGMVVMGVVYWLVICGVDMQIVIWIYACRYVYLKNLKTILHNKRDNVCTNSELMFYKIYKIKKPPIISLIGGLV